MVVLAVVRWDVLRRDPNHFVMGIVVLTGIKQSVTNNLRSGLSALTSLSFARVDKPSALLVSANLFFLHNNRITESIQRLPLFYSLGARVTLTLRQRSLVHETFLNFKRFDSGIFFYGIVLGEEG